MVKWFFVLMGDHVVPGTYGHGYIIRCCVEKDIIGVLNRMELWVFSFPPDENGEEYYDLLDERFCPGESNLFSESCRSFVDEMRLAGVIGKVERRVKQPELEEIYIPRLDRFQRVVAAINYFGWDFPLEILDKDRE
jgi:hypothetical protein